MLFQARLAVIGISLFGLSLLELLVTADASAQIRPDRSLPNRSVVPPNCRDCEITGGTSAGSNLFHSFRQFSIPAGGRAYFNQAADVQNIFARVTGSSRSVINGILQANGSANLFLLNPNGITFGRNAALNLGGSFFATAADSVRFADQTQFSASQPQPLLTLSVPTGLQFGSQPGDLISRASLAVRPQQTLSFSANGITLNRSSLLANSGSIALGSVAPLGLVTLMPNRASFRLGYAGQNFSDIAIVNGSVINTDGIPNSATIGQQQGGTAQLRGQNIQLATGSSLYSVTYAGQGGSQRLTASRRLSLNSAVVGTLAQARGRAGNIQVQADQLRLETGADRSFLASQTLAGSAGDAGDLSIRARQIELSDGSRLEASTFGTGRGGNLVIQAETLIVSGFYPRISDFNNDRRPEQIGEVPSGISVQSERFGGAEAGDAGRLTIQTERLLVQAGGSISTATFAGGNGGSLRLRAGEIRLAGVSPAATASQYRSGIFVSAEPGATGSVGQLNLTANQLSLTDRAQISARNRGAGQPGAAQLQLNQLTLQGGSEISASTEGSGQGGRLTVQANSVRLSGTGSLQSQRLPSSLSAVSAQSASGQAGNLQINADSLTVRDSAVVAVSGEGSGAAGNLTIAADQIRLNQGSLAASTQAGSGAEIRLQDADLILLQNHSQISARAFNQADGGNIQIQAPEGYLIAGANQNNDVIANAAAGNGGEITASLRGLLGLAERRSMPPNLTNDIDASSEAGAQGIVNITEPDIDPSQGIVELPANLVDAASLIAQACAAGRVAAARSSSPDQTASERPSEFVITGRGGLPSSPADPRDEDAILTDWATARSAHPATRHPLPPQPAPPITEAQSWVKDKQGNVVLLAAADSPPPLRYSLPCAASLPD